MIIFPISKLLHAPGLFFSPTRNQTDNPREAAPGRLGRRDGQAVDMAMATAKFETPALKPYPVIPLVAEGSIRRTSSPLSRRPRSRQTSAFRVS
jgi:hypothetical protein